MTQQHKHECNNMSAHAISASIHSRHSSKHECNNMSAHATSASKHSRHSSRHECNNMSAHDMSAHAMSASIHSRHSSRHECNNMSAHAMSAGLHSQHSSGRMCTRHECRYTLTAQRQTDVHTMPLNSMGFFVKSGGNTRWLALVLSHTHTACPESLFCSVRLLYPALYPLSFCTLLYPCYADAHMGYADAHMGYADAHMGYADAHKPLARVRGPRNICCKQELKECMAQQQGQTKNIRKDAC
eukprot:1162062-Pelagomonas_calceolata.AAC.36